MLYEEVLPKDFIDGTEVRKLTLTEIGEIQYLSVDPYTSIKLHDHDGLWEVWCRLKNKTAYVCLKGESHELVNKTGECEEIMAVKGKLDYSYDELGEFFYRLGFSVYHGSLIIDH